MARISTYGAESDIVGGDKWIGTAVNQNNATKNFTADAVAAFLNSSGSINSQTLRYTYKNVPIGDEREKNSLSFLTELGASVAFSSITNFVLSQYSKPGTTDVSTFYDAPLVGSNILLTNASNPKDWAIYTWNSSTQIVLEPLFYDIGLTFVAGTGGLVDDADYIISLLEYDSLNTTETLENTLIAGNNSGANGIFFDGATRAIFNTDLQIYSDAVIGYILADTLQIETENDISLKSDTQVTFNILNSDKLKITSLGVQSVADLFVNSGLYDGSGLIGTLDQVLTSTSTGTLWKDATSAVDSVNGQTGIVDLESGDVPESVNLYYTEARVTANTSVVANTAKVTFPEAPTDHRSYVRNSLGWIKLNDPFVALTDAPNITWNANDDDGKGNVTLVLGGNRILDNPSNMQSGTVYNLLVAQDATGSRTLTYGSVFKWAGGVVPTLSTAANAIDIFTFIYDGTDLYGSAVLNFS
jgi:hypothetical protein